MKRMFIGILALFCITTHAGKGLAVFDNGLTDVKSVDAQAELLNRLGYRGICSRPSNCTPELLEAFDRSGLEIVYSFVTLKADVRDIPASVVRHIESLKGRNTIIWLALTGRNVSDEQAVSVIRKVYDLAKMNGLDTVLYPHIGYRTDTIIRTEHLRKLADRPDLGISFNLCHFLAQNDPEKLEETIRFIGPNLNVVLLSGANRIPVPKNDWGELILPLGAGTFDMHRVFRVLDEVGYDGSFCLQCYKVPGPAEKHLRQSMDAWNKYAEACEVKEP
ncbi:sugar phosphate isomerase/epimerase [Verrucomicrobia bacterium S94]|nr:sugar phosphate isomerase/epimerase [Verrucomicrobia bacterium S94]